MIEKALGRSIIKVCISAFFSMFKVGVEHRKPCLTAVCETLIFHAECKSLLGMVLQKRETSDFGMVFSHPKIKEKIATFKVTSFDFKKMSVQDLQLRNDTRNKSNVVMGMQTQRREVQSHGFAWEKEIIRNVYCVTNEDLKQIKYSGKMDLPAELNRLDKCDVSIKTSCSQNVVCMSDCLRVFDTVSSGKPIHMVVIYYTQHDTSNTKKIVTITEVDLTNSRDLLFGSLTRSQIEDLDKLVKRVPQKRKPTEEEYSAMYSLRDFLQKSSGAIHLDIKCNSTQSRLQCSFNRFQQFCEKNTSRLVARSDSNNFRGGVIPYQISSSRRVFKKKPSV